MGIFLDDLDKVEYITLDELFELSEDEERSLDVTEFDENYCEITINAWDEQHYFLLRTEPEIIWESFLLVSETSPVDEKKIQALLGNINPVLFMTIPKIIFVSNESELKKIKEFADDRNQWEEDSEDILYDFIDQFLIINVEEYKRITTNKTELNQAIIKSLLSKIIDAFYSNPLYGDTTEVESKEAEKENLLLGIYNELNLDILK